MGKQYHTPFNIKAVRRKSRGEEGQDILEKKIKILKNGGGEEYQVAGNFIHLWKVNMITFLKVIILQGKQFCFDKKIICYQRRQ